MDNIKYRLAIWTKVSTRGDDKFIYRKVKYKEVAFVYDHTFTSI